HENNVPAALADVLVLARRRYRTEAGVSVDGLTPSPKALQDRLQSIYGSTNHQLNALRYILEERQKEFLPEGMRWLDIRRYGIPVSHRQQNGSLETLDADDKRKVIQIPQSAIDVGGLEPNPR